MSHIAFDASLNTKQLDDAVKQSNKNMADWAKGIEQTGDKIDKSFKKISSEAQKHTFKSEGSYKKEVGLIKDVENELKRLEEGQKKAMSLEQIEKYNRKIAETKKHLEEYNKVGLKGNTETVQSTDNVASKIGKMALAYVTATTVIKTLKETVFAFFTRSQEGIELLERKISGFKAAVGVLQGEFIKLGKSLVGEKGDESTPWGTRLVNGLRIIATTANLIPGVKKYFDDLSASMNDAGKAAEDYTRIQQDLEDAERKMIVPRAKANQEIVKARLMYADDTKSPEKRIAALEKAIKLENETAEEEIKHQQLVTLSIRDQNVQLEKRGQLTDEDRLRLEESIAEEIKLQTESYQRQIRATNSLNALKKEIQDKIDDNLKKLKKDIIDLAEALEKIDPGLGYSIVNRSLQRSGVTPATGAELVQGGKDNFKLAESSTRWYKEMQKAIKENDKATQEALTKELEKRQEILQAVSALIYQIGEQVGLSQQEQVLLASTLSSFESLVSGDYIGAATTMLIGILEVIPTHAKKFEEEIAQINKLLEDQQRLIDQSERKGNKDTALKENIEYLKELKAIQEAEQKRLQIQVASHATGFLGGLVGSGKNKLKDINADLEETNKLLQDAEQEFNDFLTGGTTENNIADVIAEGFREGKTSIDDFADYMNNTLIDAVLNVFKGEILGPAITELTKQISDSLSDKILTSEEKQSIDQKVKEIADANKELWDNLTGSLELNDGSQAGLSGGIQRSITEDTGQELSGLMRRIADDVRQGKDSWKVGINHLVNIEANTASTVEELKLAVIELKAINGNTKPSYSGDL